MLCFGLPDPWTVLFYSCNEYQRERSALAWTWPSNDTPSNTASINWTVQVNCHWRRRRRWWWGSVTGKKRGLWKRTCAWSMRMQVLMTKGSSFKWSFEFFSQIIDFIPQEWIMIELLILFLVWAPRHAQSMQIYSYLNFVHSNVLNAKNAGLLGRIENCISVSTDTFLE